MLRWKSSIAVLAAFACQLPMTAQPRMHLTLAEARRLAIQNNPQFTAARLNAAAAHQIPAQYRANYSPTLYSSLTGVGADAGSRLAAGALNNPVVYNRIGTGISLTQMVTDFGRTGNLVASADFKAKAQDEITESTRAQILLAVSRAYFSVLRAQSVLTVAEETVKARQLVSDQITALAESKLKSTLDVSFANVNLADAKLLLAQALNDSQSAQAQLAAAMGLPNESSFVVAEEPLPDPLPDQQKTLIAEAIQNRPELKSLRLEQSSADRFAKAEHALFYPSIGLVGTAGFVPTGDATVPGSYGAVGVNVNIPIFNGGLYKSRGAEARLRAQAATQNVNDLENMLTRDVRVAYLNASTAYDRLSLTEQLLQQAQLAFGLAQSRYELGLSSIVELSQAQLNLTSAQIASSTARYDYQTQRAIVDFTTGVLR
ncbi:MAG: TolC family protein [Bryobacteraceae bacterium]